MLKKYILEKKSEVEIFSEKKNKGICQHQQILTEGNPKKSSSDRRKMIPVGSSERWEGMKINGRDLNA